MIAEAVPPGRRLAVLTMGSAGVTVLLLLVVEAAFRLFVSVTDVPLYAADAALGYRRAASQSGRYIVGDHVSGRYRFNAHGWNAIRDYVLAKPEHTARVALVGDSQVEALQVQPEETMFAVAERAMRREGEAVEWLAFGVSGYGTGQEYGLIRQYALDYRPDVVVLLFVQNDPFDTSPYLVALEPYVPTYVLDDAGRLALQPPAVEWKPSTLRRLAARSAALRYFLVQRGAFARMSMLLHRQATRPDVGGMPLREAADGVGADGASAQSAGTMADRQRRTWELIARLLEAARDESARRGATFAVAFRGWPAAIDAPVDGAPPIPPKPERDPYCLASRVSEMGPACLEPIVRGLKIPYLDLTGPLRDAVARSRRSHRFPDDNHFNALGHDAAGVALGAFADSLLHSARRQPVHP